jgi:choline dehydrogenase-like flavoprotein
LSACNVGRLAKNWNLIDAYDNLVRSQRIHVCLGTRVTALTFDPNGERINGLKVRGPQGVAEGPKARAYVLAGGGLQTTALLLELQRQHPRCLGGTAGPLGRFYMGHITGEIATVVFRRPYDAADLLYQFDETGVLKQRRLRFSDDVQRAQTLLNTAFTVRTPPLANSSHGSGVLSLAYMASRVPKVRSMLRSKRFLASIDHPQRSPFRDHLGNILKRPHTTVVDAARLVLRSRTAKLPLVLLNPAGRYSLRYHAEQAPNPSSRVWLNHSQAMPAGPELSIDFRYQDEDARSILRAHETLDRLLRSSGKGHLEYWQRPEDRLAAVSAQARDGYHQIGTTKMAETSELGVVDSNCCVHGMANLFVASSSVFPTSSAANPTFTIVCLAIRLADHVARSLGRDVTVASASYAGNSEAAVDPLGSGEGTASNGTMHRSTKGPPS